MSTTTLPAFVYSHLAADPDLGAILDLFVQEMPDRINALDAQAKNATHPCSNEVSKPTQR